MKSLEAMHAENAQAWGYKACVGISFEALGNTSYKDREVASEAKIVSGKSLDVFFTGFGA